MIRTKRVLGTVSVIAVAAAAAHLFLDGLAGSLIPLQAVIQNRTGADPAILGILVSVALASASLFQPMGARLAQRFGDGSLAITGAFLAAAGYGLLPAVGHPAQAIAAVVAGGLGSAMFHPAAGALVARSAPAGQESLPVAVFSAVGMAGAALVPVAVLSGVTSLAGAAAVPFTVPLLAVATGLLFSRAVRRAAPRGHRDSATSSSVHNPSMVMPVAAAALLSLTGVTVMASTPLILAADLGATHALLGYSVAAYSASAAVGGILLALWVRRAKLRTVMLSAAGAGVLVSLAIPYVPQAWTPAAMAVAGTGLAGTLPLLVTSAKKTGETSVGPAFARILGVASGLGAVGYTGIGLLQEPFGYGPILTLTTVVAGTAALILLTRLPEAPGSAETAIRAALNNCPCSGSACNTVQNEPQPV